MLKMHAFNVGRPDNLVFVDKFLAILQERLDGQQCLYCMRTFRDRTVLKTHMRKKKHARIPPNDPFYDQFYIINYTAGSISWQSLEQEASSVVAEEPDESTWADWDEPQECDCQCLFCPARQPTAQETFTHMQRTHGFDFWALVHQWQLDFYQRIKLVNFVRHQIQRNTCPSCEATFPSSTSSRPMRTTLFCTSWRKILTIRTRLH
eukprot:m.226853 g.226853  ORF g.226853 m.226853 type:complete len:206 (-) comp54232_c0_seq2:253-870(-)